MNHLTFRYKYDGTPSLVLDDFGWLEMQVISERSSGTAGYWVQWQDVKEFVETLARYPIEADRPLSVEWGYSEKGRHERVLAVEIAPANARGDLVVRVELVDHLDPTHHIKTSFYTNCPNLTAFQIELARHMDGEAEQACLQGQ